MGGGDLNLKKSWHPQTRENQEKLWLARQAKVEEEKKLAILKKELEEQRQLEELQKLQQGTSKKLDRMDWMYAGSANLSSVTIQEEYLLGKRKITDASHEQKSFDYISCDNSNTKNNVRDVEAKLREDPLFIIKKKEQMIAKQLASNPIKMKRLQLANSIRSTISESTPMISRSETKACISQHRYKRNVSKGELLKRLNEMQQNAVYREQNLQTKVMQYRQQELVEQVSVSKDYESRHLEKNFLKEVKQDIFSTKSRDDLSTRLNFNRLYHGIDKS